MSDDLCTYSMLQEYLAAALGTNYGPQIDNLLQAGLNAAAASASPSGLSGLSIQNLAAHLIQPYAGAAAAAAAAAIAATRGRAPPSTGSVNHAEMSNPHHHHHMPGTLPYNISLPQSMVVSSEQPLITANSNEMQQTSTRTKNETKEK